ncbi:8-O-methyltransferase [Amycolatopsis echigonensis]|uniref:8-O-methyltransferase n=1 Tax=Amycolatopsis echigonensis TaxID=2576905 RepID=A0A2N3WJB0_9PSEU|nr:methyltransferase [Amycolatopsis niigatensis]PKV93955.1 8-O-methyltransferase [Amycolatopsis niigatensis]
MSATTDETISPAPLHRVNLGFAASRVLMSAVEIDLFSLVHAEGPSTEQQLRRALNLHSRFSRHFLDVLVAYGLLRVEDGKYDNTELSRRFLVKGEPGCLGAFVEIAGSRQWTAWTRFTRALRTGEHQEDSPVDDGGELFRTHVDENPEYVRRFMSAMDSHAVRAATAVAERLDFSSYQTFTDLGGARGAFAVRLAELVPHLRGTCFDRKPAQIFFDEFVSQTDVAGRVEFVGGDFFSDPLPRSDVLVLGHVLHEWSNETRAMLIRRAYDALNPGGVLVIYDRMVGEVPDAQVLLLSLTFMLTSPAGGEYHVADCREWLSEAGFRDVRFEPVLDNHTLAIGLR